jgi:cytochrome c oxidase assembly protein subunit 15
MKCRLEEATAPASESRWRHRWALLTALSTLVLIFVGGLVTSTGSGLAVPDWPLSYGMLMPPMVGGIFYEHGHRLVAASVGMLTLVLAFWTHAHEERRGVRLLAWAALAAVAAQGLLGGLTVLFLLPTPISVAHGCLAQVFFCLTIALAYVTSPEWQGARPGEDVAGLRSAALAATLLVFGQLGLGAVVRHTGAGLAIPDFPLAFGRLVPELTGAGVALHYAHRLGALVVLLSLAYLARRARRGGDARARGLAAAALGLGVVQICLGALTVLTGKAVLPATAHVATGAALLGVAWLSTLRAMRLLRPRPVRADRLQPQGHAA